MKRSAVLIIGVLFGFAFTFGFPSEPQPFIQNGEYAHFDVQIHSRGGGSTEYDSLQSIQAEHGLDCSGSLDNTTFPVHENHSYSGAVFICNDHLMTTLNDSNYGVIYLTPTQMLDWSQGTATMSFNISTHQDSSRDWWDVWLSGWDDNIALPLEDFLPDLQGPKDGNALGVGKPYLHIKEGPGGRSIQFSNQNGVLPSNNATWVADSKAVRDQFTLTINATMFTFCKTSGEDIPVCWATNIPHGLGSLRQAVVQFGHHSYNPTKDGAGIPGTWHWSDFNLSPSVPFTLIHCGPIATKGGGINCDTPAPSGSVLRFAAIGKPSINGVSPVPKIPTTHPEHFNSYAIPIAIGSQSFTVTLGTDQWYNCGFGCAARDFAIWSKGGPSSTPTPVPTNTATPTTTPIPTVTATVAPIPTSTNTPSVTVTLSPVPSTATPSAIRRQCTLRWGNTTIENYGMLTQEQCAARGN